MMASLPNNLRMLCESLLWPLNVFYARYGREMPQITPLFPQHVPEPYKKLLVHENNMTPTLEAFHGSRLFIERINELPAQGETTREVILRTETEAKPVEYGASRVFLSGLTSEAIRLMKEGHVPLGTILRTCHCHHTVEPAGYFKIKPTVFFEEALGASSTVSLYGRRNQLVALDGTIIAEVCEVLPPLNGDSGACRRIPSSARERATFLPDKDGEAGDVGFIVDTAGCSQTKKGPLEARSNTPTGS